MSSIKLKDGIYQDGADFFSDLGGHITGYPNMVKHDHDMDGAVAARQQFARDFPYHVEIINA